MRCDRTAPRDESVPLACLVVVGYVSHTDMEMANMIIELGRASTETKGIPFGLDIDPSTVTAPKRAELVQVDMV